MENNSQLATPVNIQGTGPGGTPIEVAIEPLPLPVEISSQFSVRSQGASGGSPALVDGVVLSAFPCELRSLTGYCSDPNPAAQYWLQLHDAAAAPLAPGANPLVIVPLRGGYQAFSYVQPIRTFDGLVLALSVSEYVFAPAASPWLLYTVIVGLEP